MIENTKLTVIITSSLIPSHPSIEVIKQTIESLKFIGLKKENSEVLIAQDNHPKRPKKRGPRYGIYMKRLQDYLNQNPDFNYKILKGRPGNRIGLVGNVMNAFKHVKSEYVLIIQHDLPFLDKGIDINKVMEDMKSNPKMKHVRFNRKRNIPRGFDGENKNLFGNEIKANNYTYTSTGGWSDNNHICLASYYRNVVFPRCKPAGFMEKFLNGKHKGGSGHKESNHIFGTYLYGPKGENPVIWHKNGRKFIAKKENS